MEKIGGYIAQTAGLNTCWDMRYEALVNTYSQPRSNCKYLLLTMKFIVLPNYLQ